MATSRPMCTHGGCPLRAASGSPLCLVHTIVPPRPAPRADCAACSGTGWVACKGLPAITECACRGAHGHATLVWVGTSTEADAARQLGQVEAMARAEAA